jgi:hypothetical protein
MISGSIKNVELMDLVTNAVQFSVKVLNGRSVRILKFVVKESETKEEGTAVSHKASTRQMVAN